MRDCPASLCTVSVEAPADWRDNQGRTAMARINYRPVHPERICWGCEKYCPAENLACGNGTIRCPHPVELFGDEWLESVAEEPASAADSAASDSPGPSASDAE